MYPRHTIKLGLLDRLTGRNRTLMPIKDRLAILVKDKGGFQVIVNMLFDDPAGYTVVRGRVPLCEAVVTSMLLSRDRTKVYEDMNRLRYTSNDLPGSFVEVSLSVFATYTPHPDDTKSDRFGEVTLSFGTELLGSISGSENPVAGATFTTVKNGIIPSSGLNSAKKAVAASMYRLVGYYIENEKIFVK